MIPLPGSLRIWLYRGPTDLRRSFDGLSGMVRTHLDGDPLSGALYVFLNRRRTLVKILYWDRDGFAVWAKRLESGVFSVPAAVGDRAELSSAQLSMLLEGITPLRLSRRFQILKQAG